MSNGSLPGLRDSKKESARLPAKASVSAAVFFALYGTPYAATADEQSANGQQQEESPPSLLQQVTVTANRRQQTLEEVPYSITAVSADQISSTGVTDIVSLARQVPGLSMYDFGARSSGSVFPIIRGLNASAASSGFRTFEQAPVGTYLGNSPLEEGYIQLDDVQRVEVLRGPQGTLYGAGALGGALRIIPNAPQLNTFSGNVEFGGGSWAHASDPSYTATGMVNVPLGDTLAFRASGKYAYDPGFIDVYGLVKRTGSQLSGLPVLADPTDPINSPAIYSGKNDWNDQNAFTGRSSLLWKPADQFNAELAFTYSNVNGNSAPAANSLFTGGAYPGDPRITFPRGGDYQNFDASDEPWSRRTTLASVDLSYDAGFATLSSTSSYQTTNGVQLNNGTYNILALPGFTPYYAGNPINPRFVRPMQFADQAHTFTQEVRLVSNPGPDKRFDYVVGVFYEDQTSEGSWDIRDPGSPERAVAQGCTAPYFFGASFPNCLIAVGPGDTLFYQDDTQHFQDKSEFAELTWHFVEHGQIAFGGRHFQQSFTDSQSYLEYAFATLVPAHADSAPASKNTWKINPSYEYAPGQHVYALWSQGFRRGGANAVPIGGPVGETSRSLLSYGPDSTNNYEVGLKGRFANGLTYAFDVFDTKWDNPQVAGGTPIGNLAVWNAKKAESKGAELDLSTPLPLPGLSLTVGGTYADAKFTEAYFIPADVYGSISAKAGEQLPGSAKVSAAATINYDRSLAPGYDLAVSLNDTYRGPMSLSTFAILGIPPTPVPGMGIANLSASISHQSWRLGAYVTNLADKRVILTPPSLVGRINNLDSSSIINPPREIALRLSYSFGRAGN